MKDFLKSIDFNKNRLNTYITLLSAPVLLTIFWYFGKARFFKQIFIIEPASNSEFYTYVLEFIAFFILMFIIPALFIKLRLNKNLKDFGLGLGDISFGLKFVAIAVPLLIVPIIYFASKMPDIRGEYPLFRMLYLRKDLVFLYELCYVIFYYLAWEFYFRGFLLFSLKNEFGGFNAILIQTISSCLIHIGKPPGETIGAIIVGVIFGLIALRAKSIWYVFILHASIGVLTDLFIIYT
jgi:membrane protease YdiL (CAAX protease family)